MTPRKTSLIEDLKSPAGMFWLGSYIAFVLLGWFTPSTILQDHAWAREFADFMASIIPQIDRVTVLGGAKAGEANRFVYSVLWVILPGHAYLLMVSISLKIRSHGFSKCSESIERDIGPILIAVVIFLEGVFLWVNYDSRLVNWSFRNEFGRVLWAPAIAFAPMLSLILIRVGIWNIYSCHVLGEKPSER